MPTCTTQYIIKYDHDSYLKKVKTESIYYYVLVLYTLFIIWSFTCNLVFHQRPVPHDESGPVAPGVGVELLHGDPDKAGRHRIFRYVINREACACWLNIDH